MEEIKRPMLFMADIIEIVGALIILFGFLKSLSRYVLTEEKDLFSTPFGNFQKIRCEIGMYILLALDFLIVADIIQTLSQLSSSQLIELSALIILRIAIGYFLGKEIEEITINQEK